MKLLASAFGRALLRAFIAALIVYGIGISAAPDLNKLVLVGVATLVGLIAGGLRALQAYLVKTSFAHWLGDPYGEWIDSFVQAFVGSLIITLTGALPGAPDLATWKALVASAITGAFGAAMRALQGAFTKGEFPAPGAGVNDPLKP